MLEWHTKDIQISSILIISFSEQRTRDLFQTGERQRCIVVIWGDTFNRLSNKGKLLPDGVKVKHLIGNT